MAEPAQIDFYYGLDSRYSYLASTQIDTLEKDTGCRVVWHPLKRGALATLRGTNPFAGTPVSGQYETSYREYDAACWADYYGVAYRDPVDQVSLATTPAIACAAAGRLGRLVDYSRRMFRAIFVDGVVIDEGVCADIAEALGLDRATFLETFHDPDVDTELDSAAVNAHRRGVFGVPTFVVGERLFWGNDRLPLVRHFVGELPTAD
jgi:2-hydroxychromene-2-carboxylate isomerase